MLKEFSVLRLIISFILPFIVLYSIYIQLNGEVSPGGGFQAGVIFASAVIGYELIFDKKFFEQKFSIKYLKLCSILGVLLYAGTGFVSLIYDNNYLNYNVFHVNIIIGQHIGIFLIEVGVGLTVSSVMSLIYILLKEE
ncbi:MAG: Na(+)/H(+) antiporter subunit B [Rickettsiales bacterium]|nr:MAG: Na(+)/H(+) antiporter subunit B [Rickettsiales bacterium]